MKKVKCPTCCGKGELEPGLVAFSFRMKELRGGKTQDDFAQSLGTTRSKIANFENGRHAPQMKMLITIADKFNVTTDWLLGRS